MKKTRKIVRIVGERGLVSNLLQERLVEIDKYDFEVLPTDTAQSPSAIATLEGIDLVVLCTLEFSSPQVIKTIPSGTKVLDISPAFRTHPDWVYGLPELPGMPERIRQATRVANPGCFATSAILALAPLIRNGSISPSSALYLDGAGGFTTGGSSMIQKEAAGELAQESVFSLTREHRHIPEIKHFAGLTGAVWFTPKIARVPRGIRMQVPLPGISKEKALEEYRAAYLGTEVEVSLDCPSKIPVDAWANRDGACLQVFDQPGGCLVVCVMDNLGKGAVGAALTNISLMLE